MTKKINRRDLLKLVALASGSTLVACTKLSQSPTPTAKTEPTETNPPTSTAKPEPTKTSPPTSIAATEPTETPQDVSTTTSEPIKPSPAPIIIDPRVVHVHNSNATHWDGSSDYWNYVSQVEVDAMVDQGLMDLTGKSTLSDAWGDILPDYLAGQKIAIKVSFNNTAECGSVDFQIDSVIEPINAVIRGLKSIGVAESDIWLYDAVRTLPSRFINGCDFNGVEFYGTGTCNTPATFSSNDPTALVHFNTPAGGPELEPQRLADVVVNADYLINIPIMKIHGMSGVSLAFKNHYGTTQKPKDLHIYSAFASPDYSPDYSPFIDIHSNPNIIGKTVLTISDSLFCALGNTRSPATWTTFGNNVPNSLLFSRDPVAIDSIMCDLLKEEGIQRGAGGINKNSDDYLVLAHNANFGIFERGNPWASPPGSGYSQIDYHKIEL